MFVQRHLRSVKYKTIGQSIQHYRQLISTGILFSKPIGELWIPTSMEGEDFGEYPSIAVRVVLIPAALYFRMDLKESVEFQASKKAIECGLQIANRGI